jgi:hypothetical protein
VPLQGAASSRQLSASSALMGQKFSSMPRDLRRLAGIAARTVVNYQLALVAPFARMKIKLDNSSGSEYAPSA